MAVFAMVAMPFPKRLFTMGAFLPWHPGHFSKPLPSKWELQQASGNHKDS